MILEKKKIGRRSGGADNPDQSILDNDYYFDKETAEFIFKYLEPHLHFPEYPQGVSILDLCSGESCVLGTSINNIIQNSKKNIYGKSLSGSMYNTVTFVDKKFGNDLFTYKYQRNEYHIIVCNPPWIPVDLAFNIYKKCLKLLSPSGVLFFKINNTFIYQGPERWSELKGQKYYFLPRYVFDNSINRKIRNKNIEARDDLDDKTKIIKYNQPILLDAGILVYHPGNSISYNAVNLLPIIPVPRHNPGATLPGF